jgi:hypothetical protein
MVSSNRAWLHRCSGGALRCWRRLRVMRLVIWISGCGVPNVHHAAQRCGRFVVARSILRPRVPAALAAWRPGVHDRVGLLCMCYCAGACSLPAHCLQLVAPVLDAVPLGVISANIIELYLSRSPASLAAAQGPVKLENEYI